MFRKQQCGVEGEIQAEAKLSLFGEVADCIMYPSKQLESLFAVSQTGGNVRFSYV